MDTTQPKSKAIKTSPYLNLRRIMPNWATPQMEARRWRNVVRNQPVAMVCRDRLISYVQSLRWEVRPRNPKNNDKYEYETGYYTYLLEHAAGHGFDWLLDVTLQDALDLPIGGNIEVVRWDVGASPFENEHPRGHVAALNHIDGATLRLTQDEEYPLVQQVGVETVYFKGDEIARMLFSPRPELELNGLGMPPPERIYLALTMLYNGDKYYSQLLLDIPEAGILDLGNMSRESAGAWLSGLRSLLEGSDAFKVPVLYEHDTPAKFIPFGRPPTEMLFDNVSEKYKRLTAAGYWLTLSDIGLESDSSLAGQIRRERAARLTGFGVVKEKTKNLINGILPPYLEFEWVEKDEEAMVAKGKAALVMTQAVAKMVESGIISTEDAQNMLKSDGLISVNVQPPAPPSPPNQPQLTTGGNEKLLPQETNNIINAVPADSGGRGDIRPTTTKSLAGYAPLPHDADDEDAATALEWYYDGAETFVGRRVFSPEMIGRIEAGAASDLAALTGLSVAATMKIIDGINNGTIHIAGLSENDITGDVGEVVRAAHQITAAALASAETSHMIIYRVFPVVDGVRLNDVLEIDVVGIDAWMVDANDAIAAADTVDGLVLSMVVPTGRIVSTFRTGFGKFGDVYIDVLPGDMGQCYYNATFLDGGK